jgi:hypothetical protein
MQIDMLPEIDELCLCCLWEAETPIEFRRNRTQLTAYNSLTLVCLFWSTQDIQNSPAAKAYTEIADSIDDLKFSITDNEELFKEFGIKTDDAVVIFKKVGLHTT